METKRFTKNESGFVCAHCGKTVEPLGFTSRNHCPFCLWSLHLDENPGDRASDCGGLMEPVSAEPDPKRGFVITHRCTKCGAISATFESNEGLADRNAFTAEEILLHHYSLFRAIFDDAAERRA